MTPATGQLPSSLSWLQDVEEVRYPLGELRPIWVRHGRVRSGPALPQPAVPAPQRHPFCEFNLLLQGRAQQFIQREQVERPAGTVQLLGPGVAHYALILDYPHEFATIYFLPSLLLELGPERDGPRLLGRFTARQTLAQRLLQPPPALRQRLATGFRQMSADFERPQFGSEMQLRTTLVRMLIELVRWEEQRGQQVGRPAATIDWGQLDRALRYLREHYADTVYAHDLAAAAGMNKSQLQALFREALGMPWVQYLQSYRVHQAALIIGQDPHTVTEAAMAVGFSTLSHFNAAFRKFMGMSPSAYLQHTRRLPS